MRIINSFYINGEWVEPTKKDPNIMTCINPSNETPYASLSLGSEEDADKAVAAAKFAFADWSHRSPEERLSFVSAIEEIYVAHADQMSQSISTEMGAPIDFALSAQTASGFKNIECFHEAFESLRFDQPLVKIDGIHHGRLHLDPIGVTALITPWNWPINQITKKVIPALLAGCTIVLKPSEFSPLSAQLFAEICHEAGLPKGVFNMIYGLGEVVGRALTTHKDVDMVSFTGSTKAGKDITIAAAETLKKVTLELGGKGANIIFANSDNDAVKRSVLRCFNNSGQSCNSPTRLLVERSIYEIVLKKAKETAENVVVDIASKSGDHIGPVVSQKQYEKIQELIQSGIDEGAKLLVGGVGRHTNFEKGYFVKPTIFYDVKPNMRIFREEIFGPVLSIIPFDNEEEAIAIANDTEYGLTNYIQSQNEEQCYRVANKLRSGMVELNGKYLPKGAFFGGVKHSGRAREGGLLGILEFLDSKAITNF